MKERPILFSAPMVRAILEGRKTQTRRVAKVKFDTPSSEQLEDYELRGWDCIRTFGQHKEEFTLVPPCPYGQRGDRLWVLESFWQYGRYVYTGRKTEKGKPEIAFEAIGQDVVFDCPEKKPPSRFDIGFHKRPSIFLERWASRITLEITGLRVERLQDISQADAIAEGVYAFNSQSKGLKVKHYYRSLFPPNKLFKQLWYSINGLKSWDANPWVWVIEFEKLESKNDQ